MVSARSMVVGMGIAVFAASLAASTLQARAQAPERLGKVNFPTSCSPAVQPQVERAVAPQHSFSFRDAIKPFNAVATAQPSSAVPDGGVWVPLPGSAGAGPP